MVKQMLCKADEEGRDPYIALLAYRNTAVTGMSYSPAQMLMSRVLNSKIPILPALLEPKIVDPRPQLEQRQHNDDTRPYSTEERESCRSSRRARKFACVAIMCGCQQSWSERMATLGPILSNGAERSIDVTDEIYCKLLKSCRETTTRSTTRSLMRHRHQGRCRSSCSPRISGSTLTCCQPHGGTSVTKAKTRYSASS